MDQNTCQPPDVSTEKSGSSANVIGYARVVPGNPEEDAAGALQHQRDRLEAYCKGNSLTLKEFFSEEISGDISLDGRPALSIAIAACRPGDTLLVVRLDRLSSQKKIVAEIFQQCQGKNIRVAAIAGPQSVDEIRNSLEVTVQAG